MPEIATTPALVQAVYERLSRNLEIVRGRLNRPLSYAEKILLGHLHRPESESLEPGRAYIEPGGIDALFPPESAGPGSGRLSAF